MTAFPPIIQSDAQDSQQPPPRVLILGSMPSRTSLSEQRYYAHPRNSFWWIMGELIGFNSDLDYFAKGEMLINSQISVWDVLVDCERAGSLDSNIVRSSEQVNDFAALFKRYPSIELIAFNGGAAKSIFMRHCGNVLIGMPNISWLQLPSTSPAYASINRNEKLQLWRSALTATIET